MSTQDSKPSKAAPKNARPLAQQRRKARHYGMQALYQWQMTQNPLSEIEAAFRSEYNFAKVDGEYFTTLVHEVPANLGELDSAFAEYLSEKLSYSSG